MDTTFTSEHEVIVILDFGSQYTHLIARRLREAGVYCELHACNAQASKIMSSRLRGIILSGGPASVYEKNAPHVDSGIFDLDVPILGICYGLQEIAHMLDGGEVIAGPKREFGHADVTLCFHNGCGEDIITNGNVDGRPESLFAGLPATFPAWMSHGDKIAELPNGFVTLATTANTEFAAVAHPKRRLYGFQFHPEVTHTPQGAAILHNFALRVCGCRGDWTMANYLEEAKAAVRRVVGDGIVVGAVSGGVDSTVAAVLMKEAIGCNFHAFLVDNGLLRKDEANRVRTRLAQRCGVNVSVIDASQTFLDRLHGVTEPEQKRRVIGHTFIECFEREASLLNAGFLLQGTLYPDVIESASHLGPSVTIKTHHNVGGLPEHMGLTLVEPLRLLFKDEVRALGLQLNVEADSVFRHPFPGPGLAIRILGDVTDARLRALRDADDIFIYELRQVGLYREIGQAFAVLLPVKAVGVMGDKRTYEEVIALRAVKTNDFMTADWFDLPTPLLRKVSSRIVNEVAGVNRVTYDITSKPPGTIEWE